MSRNYNRFGATFDKVMALYPGTSVEDYDSQEAIEDCLDVMSRMLASAMSPAFYDQLTEPQLELVVRRAVASQATAQLGLTPVVANTIRLWRISGGALIDQRQLSKPQPGVAEEAGYTLNIATGAITVITPALGANDLVYASYQVDVENTAFSIGGLADVVIYGAAADLGAKLYTEGSQAWELVETYRKRWESALEALRDGTLVPDELRAMRWWTEVDRATSQIRTIDLLRG